MVKSLKIALLLICLLLVVPPIFSETTCDDGFYLRAITNKCEPCLANCKSCSELTAINRCTTCKSGYKKETSSFSNSRETCVKMESEGIFQNITMILIATFIGI